MEKTIKELKAQCKAQGLKGYSSMKREDLVRLLQPVPLYEGDALKVLSLFCGCGGLDDGFHRNAKFKVVRAMDTMKHAVDTHNLNFSTKAEVKDVKDLLHADFALGFSPDVIIGGPPCQGFSLSGKRAVDDARNYLFMHYLRFVHAFQPKVAVLENVRLLTSMKSRNGALVKDDIQRAFSEHGYSVGMYEVNAKDYGVPQHRERVFFCRRSSRSKRPA